jgi:DNA modification methylase
VDYKKMIGIDDTDVPQIKLRPLDSLVAYARNARTHSPAQVKQLQGLLLEFGWTNAVLMDEMGIVAGHGRCLAAAEIYKQGKQIKFPNGSPIPIGYVPTLDCTGWSDLQRKAYILADNRSALASSWDEELLSAELKYLEDMKYDLSFTAFDDDEISELLAVKEVEATPEPDSDDAPDIGEKAVTVDGDVWLCGKHKVCCGSALSPDDWDRLMGGELADVVWTDPPYNVDIGAKNKSLDAADGLSRSKTGGIANDKMTDKAFCEFLQSACVAIFQQMKAGAPIYIAHSDKESANFTSSFKDAGFKLQSILVWRKNMMVLGMCDWQSVHESILYGWKIGSRHRWYGGRKNTSVIELGEGSPFMLMEDGRYQIKIGDSVLVVSADAMVEEHPSSILYEPKPSKSGLHPTQKPVALIERMLKQSARAGDLVVDAFGGSGSTMIAADRLGMQSRLMEYDERFCDVICRRYWHYSGVRPVHAVTGELFPEEDQQRLPDNNLNQSSLGDGDLF